MNKKRIIIISVILVVMLSLTLGAYYILTKEDKNTTLNLLEKQWIESNKNKVFDMSIVNEVPVFNFNGEGLFFDFMKSLEEITGLEFNKISYAYENDIDSKEYTFKITDNVGNNDILIYQDDYVLLTKNKVKYNSLTDINKLTIGVLDVDLEKANIYLKGASNITFKSYDNTDLLINDMNVINNQEKDATVISIDAIILPRNLYLTNIISNDNLNIAYTITEMNKYYVLTLGSIEKLNDIITKYYNKWTSENYNNSYQFHFANNFFTSKNIGEKEKVEFRSKRYTYGYVENIPYDTLYNEELLGINNVLIREFANLANIEINYKEYPNVNDLVNNFNKNQIDFFYNNTVINNYDMDIYNTISNFDEKVVIVSDLNNKIIINSLNSLINKEVYTIKGSQITKYLEKNNINTKVFNNINSLLANKDESSIIALDELMYNYYLRSDLINSKIDYDFTLPNDYKYTIRDISDNKVFNEFLNFYLSLVVMNETINTSYNELLNIDTNKITKNEIIIGVIILLILIIILWYIKKPTNINNKNEKPLTKEGKLKYIDLLTSLKNRNYLNDNIEKWDESEIYPQAIIVVDLNNIAYINDNYGHSEGDKVIKEASNILIKNQIENTEIMRTNGNEFLIYMVGYDEKQVVSYIRKLNKEFKELDHGFGAAIGYSIIMDPIKTIDDAVNEATLDMRGNKEELNN